MGLSKKSLCISELLSVPLCNNHFLRRPKLHMIHNPGYDRDLFRGI